MKKLYIIDRKANPVAVYGIGTYITELETVLRSSGMYVCFIHLNSENQQFIEKIENDVSHWYIPSSKLKYQDEEKNNNFYFKNAIFILRQYIQPEDSLIFHLNFLQCKYFVDEIRKYFNCKIVLTIHYFTWSLAIFGNVSRLRKIIGKPEIQLDQFGKQLKKSFMREKELFYAVDKVISLSYHSAEILPQIYRIKKTKYFRYLQWTFR